MNRQLDADVLNDWFVVAAASSLTGSARVRTILLGAGIVVWRDDAGAVHATADTQDAQQARQYLAQDRYGFVWVCLGTPQKELFALPEFDEPGRRFINAGTFGVKTSGLRIIENFLDMGHFPYVHTDVLGKDPHSEVADYKVTTNPETGEIWATECRFWQPKAAASAEGGLDVEYTYRVMQPFSSILYKTSPGRENAFDVIGVYVQPLQEDECKATLWLLLFDDENSDTDIIAFQQTIFAQDRPILENQLPKLMPLEPRAETPTRADATSMAYRRRLRELGWQYGVKKAAKPA
jgi:phenylpropionate dioxygenase-like ring-hydroxylating dioxygenase large terminal subunit